jgi:hypothetical protein
MAARQRFFGVMALSCLMGCGGAERHAVAPGEHAESDVESRPLDKSALSEEARARFEEEKIKVVDSDSSSSYAFQDGRGEEISQEEFTQRYEELTGRTDLDQATHGKPGTPLIVTGALLMGAAVIGEIVLFVLSQQKRQTCMPAGMISNQNPLAGPMGQFCYDNGSAVDPGAEIAGSLGLAALAAGGTALLLSGIHSNRSSHEISRDDAEDYVHLYNRALLDKALRSLR